jgi:hypothetical protein
MSSYLIAPASTTPSSSSSRSPGERGAAPCDRQASTGPEDRKANTANTAIIACGALGGHIRQIAARRGWDVRVDCLPAALHNKPRHIVPAAERMASELLRKGMRVVLAYADCGTYGELDRLCDRLGLARLPGLHCYDVFAGPDRVRAELESEPGTYLLTDFLVRSFQHSVLDPLGLVTHPELWSDYFGHYRRLVWFRQSAEAGLAAQADSVAAMFGLPLTVVDVGVSRLERELESVLGPGAMSAKDCGRIGHQTLQDLLGDQ